MPSFRQRSNEKELLDGEGLPFDDIRQNMQELDTINQQLGGHRITLKGVKALLDNKPAQVQLPETLHQPAYEDLRQPIHIAEIGCGGGDNLRVIKEWAARTGRAVILTGVDLNPECIAYAKSRQRNAGISFIESDYRTAQFATPPDIIFSSLFCHHFTDDELVAMLGWLRAHSRKGFFINDLHRHPLAYYSISLLTKLFSKSYLVKNDAPLSVRRGFKKREWQELMKRAGISTYSCSWQWAFRWLIIYLHGAEPAL